MKFDLSDEERYGRERVPHHTCRCGNYAERNQFGELLCFQCSLVTDLALQHRQKVIKFHHEIGKMDEARNERRIAAIRKAKDWKKAFNE